MTHVYRVTAGLVFPAGLSPGEGRDANLASIARRLDGTPVLRGTSIAGVLRHAWARSRGVAADSPEAGRWFGVAADRQKDSADNQSPLRVADASLDTGRLDSELRTHIAIDRHRGAVVKGVLFNVESLPPMTRAALDLELHDGSADAEAFLSELLGLLHAGLGFGGSGARGIGRGVIDGSASVRRFDCETIEGMAAYLDNASGGGEAVSLEPAADPSRLIVDLDLRVPRGQDALVADGQGLDHELEPQRVVCADGRLRYRIPGSSLRGLFRGWITRLAAREGHPVADSLERFNDRYEAFGDLTGDDLAHGFETPARRELLRRDPSGVACPVMRMFGSAYERGRVHFEDVLFDADGIEPQERMHVAIDRVSGGTNDGMLFSNTVLTSAVQPVRVRIVMESPPDGRDWSTEARWLASTIRALDMGLIRVGSSKAAGRLGLAAPPRASGPHADLFHGIQPIEGSDA